jgi:hypothetical protein
MSITMLLVHVNAGCSTACIIVKVFLEMACIGSYLHRSWEFRL